MKILSYLSLIGAGVCLIIAFIARYFTGGELLFTWRTLITGVTIFLLASIAFALHHLIMMKSK